MAEETLTGKSFFCHFYTQSNMNYERRITKDAPFSLAILHPSSFIYNYSSV